MSRPATESEFLARMMPPSVAATGLRAGRCCAAHWVARPCSVRPGCSPPAGAAVARRRPAPRPPARCPSGPTSPTRCRRRRTRRSWPGSATPRSRSRPTLSTTTRSRSIDTYPQGQPDDVFTWFAGYRMQFFAQQGLVGDVSDVWQNVQGMSGRDEDRLDPRGRQAVLRAVPRPTRGRSTTGPACSRRRATPPRRRWTSWWRCRRRCRPTGSCRSRSPTRTAGRRWARSTSSTCGSTATTTTST